MIRGGCLCGAVRYETMGEPLFGVVCHCRDCQKASGSGHVPVMGVAKSAFRVTGNTRTAVTTGSSGMNAVRHFCPECGSLLFGTPEAAPDLVTIYAGSLDDSSMFRPTGAIFVRDRRAWDPPDPALEEFDGPRG